MKSPTSKPIEIYLKIALALAVVALFVLCALLVQEYRHVRQTEFNVRFSTLGGNIPAGASNVDIISTWMTFDYINHLFNLTPQYLQTNLAISDSRYPHITLEEYAKDAGIAKSIFVSEVQNSIEVYFSQNQ